MAIEFLLVISMLVGVFLLMLQYAVKAHAERIATAAADDGLAVASSYRGSSSAGQSAARESLAPFRSVYGAHVDVTRSATNATVTITGHVDQLVPFLDVAVRVHVEGPVERFVDRPGQLTQAPAQGQP